MIDFWELSGRLLLMDPAKRRDELYTNILTLQQGGCIVAGNCPPGLIQFPIHGFYNQLRDYFMKTYAGPNKLLSPVISMFALGEIGTMFFNQKCRNLFEGVSSYLRTDSVLKGRWDTGSAELFYMMVMLLTSDRTTRASVQNGDFLGLAPADKNDREVLRQLANDSKFAILGDRMCLDGGWTEGSFSTLRDQSYGKFAFRHFRFGPP